MWRDDADCVLSFLQEGYSCPLLPCHVQYPTAIESWTMASECGSMHLDLDVHREAFSNHQHVHTY